MAVWKVGDRVVRHKDVFDDSSPVMHGTVSRVVVNIQPGQLGFKYAYPEIVWVRWDGGREEGGYLPHGLGKESLIRERRGDR